MKGAFLLFVRVLACSACTIALLIDSVAGEVSPPLLIVGGAIEQPLRLSTTDLQGMQRTTLKVHDKNGSEVTFEGVALYEVLKRAKPRLTEKCCSNSVNTVVIIRASDNYQALFSLPEIDPKFSDSQILIADHREGQLLSSPQGPLQIIVPDDKVHARWVRRVNSIEVLPLGEVKSASINSRPQ